MAKTRIKNYNIEKPDHLALFVLHLKYLNRDEYEIFTSAKSSFERFNLYKTSKYITSIEKMEIKAINGFLTSDYLIALETNNQCVLLKMIDEVEKEYKHAELIRHYPKLTRLREICPTLTPSYLSELIGYSPSYCLKMISEKGKINSCKFSALSKICDSLNLCPSLFLD